MNRRGFLKVVTVGASASVLIACGPAVQAPARRVAAGVPAAVNPAVWVVSVSPTRPPAAEPKRGGILKQGYQGDPVSLDPMLKVQNDVAWVGIFERLTAYDDQ